MARVTETDLQKIERLFRSASRLAPWKRDEFLATECQGNDALKCEVEELLQSALATGPLDHAPETPIDLARLSPATPPRIPEHVGQFEILEVIASGGMGTVYEALQEQPRRSVALKVMRWELTSREALRRFHYESELLAQLQHPGIAQVYEAGVHDAGGLRLPYFAMELISGVTPITRYAEQKDLDLRTRLELFAQVCDAVDYGHQRGVIHRDLKPSNIVVGEDARPRVIDFGVARSTDCDTTLTTLQTETGQLLGTLQYMSPEQCTGKSDAIDTRSDVYSLGVVLFELLSGRLPYDVSGMSVYEGTRVVIENTPTTLSSADQTLRGEVETIVHKALEKESSRRYGTANELAADIRRFLNGEAITARPPSVAYQLKVFARRNKALVMATACVLVVLVIGFVSTSAALIKANRTLHMSQSLSHGLSDALSVAMETISSVDPTAAEISYGDEPTEDELWDRVATLLENEIEFAENSLDEAELRLKLGRAYRHMGRFSEAQRHLEKAVAIRRNVLGIHPKVAECLLDLSYVYGGLGSRNDHPAPLSQIIDWYESGQLPKCLPVGIAYQGIAWEYYNDKHELDESLRLHNCALEILRNVEGPEGRQIAWCLNNRGDLYGALGKLEEQYKDFKDALDMRLHVLGHDHSHTIHNYLMLAGNSVSRHKLDEALKWAKKGWDGVHSSPRIDENHHYYRFALERYSDVLYHRGEFEEAEPILRELISYWDRQGRSPLSGRWQLGMCLLYLGKFEESEVLLLANYEDDAEQALDRKKPWYVTKACWRLVLLYDTWGKPEKAAEWRTELEALQAQHPEVVNRQLAVVR